MTRTNIWSILLSVGFSAWALSLFPYGTTEMQSHVAFYMAVTVIGCIFCLTHLQSAAFIVTLIVNTTFVVFFSATGHPHFIAMSINVALITAAMLMILIRNHRDFRDLVHSRLVLEEEQARIIELSNENFHLANLDSLTDLPNRRSFFSSLREAVKRAHIHNGRTVIGILDLDGFKPVNDTHGHPVGDALLRQIARRLRAVCGEHIEVFRLGGDEFALLFKGPEISEAMQRASEICTLMREAFVMPACTARISCTVGIASYPDMASDETELFEKADYAMYRAKRGAGRGDVQLFSDQDEAEIRRASIIEQALKNGALDKELSLMFQPIVNVRSGKPTGFEALARWNCPELGNVSPDEFIPIAERCGLISTLTAVLLKKALKAAEAWPKSMRLSFNLSIYDISSAECLMLITSIIGNSNISPKRIDMEITETAMVNDLYAIMAHVEALRSIGVGISLDDFGTGYSSLRQVHQLPLDKLKIDRSFVQDINTNLASQKIVGLLISMCNELKIDCVLEGVETEAELSMLRKLGARLVQGYYFAKPMHEADICAYIRSAKEVAKQTA